MELSTQASPPSGSRLQAATKSSPVFASSPPNSQHITHSLDSIIQKQLRHGGQSEDTPRIVRLSPSLNADQVSALATALRERCNAKEHQREQWRVNQANYRRRQREKEQQIMHEVKNMFQSMEEYKETTPSLPEVETTPSLPGVETPTMTMEAWKKTRRREQCRLSQARYRERKRLQELQANGKTSPKNRFKPRTNFMAVKDPNMTTEEWKKARRREQCRLGQARYRERKRLQKLQTDGDTSSKNAYKLRKDFMTAQDPNMSFEEWKKARRREQTRIYQVNYWKRKRELEEKLVGEVNEIKQDIEQLQMQQSTHGPHKHRIKLVETFHRSLQTGIKQQQVPDIRNYRLVYGCTPALQALSDLQREEFDSMESLELHWLWYRTQFRVFELSVTSFERVEAAEHVIIQVKGSLRLGMYRDGNTVRGMKAGNGELVCPVRHLFEFEKCEPAVIRITSEVDLVGGVVASQMRSGLGCALTVLDTLP
ncbi:hypothetical protein PHYBOEH_007143 [Phytophthora boehmeriae]|uniref:Uncharacterized protein n=1 Tax=Phytophthora boehmeriae TaxID=109152 RepID=A0A8T1W9C1_9STRA|nr:hypothetical protein PHYBOEH_007143 [Phytophthora boehmeriae]